MKDQARDEGDGSIILMLLDGPKVSNVTAIHYLHTIVPMAGSRRAIVSQL